MSGLFDLSSLDNIKAGRLIEQVKMGLPQIESDEAILRFLREQQTRQGIMTVPEFVQAYRLRHAAMSRQPIAPPMNDGNERGRGAGGVAMSRPSALPIDDDDDMQRAMRASIISESNRQKEGAQLEKQLNDALALSKREGVQSFLNKVVAQGSLPELPRASSLAAAAASVSVPVPVAPVCSPLWSQLSPEQRNPFYVPGTVTVNVEPVVEFPEITFENVKPVVIFPKKTVPNVEMRKLLDFFFPEMKKGQPNFEDTCPYAPSVTPLIDDKELKERELLRDTTLTWELLDEPVILYDGTTCSKITADQGKVAQGVGAEQQRNFATARPNSTLQAFIDSLKITPEQRETFGGKSKKMQKNKRKSQSRKRSQSRRNK